MMFTVIVIYLLNLYYIGKDVHTMSGLLNKQKWKNDTQIFISYNA